MDGEDYRTGSADSENSSDNSYVQVSKEDAQNMDPPDSQPQNDSPKLVSGIGMSAEDYTLEEGDSTTTKQEATQVSSHHTPIEFEVLIGACTVHLPPG